jgi:electron transfer flavoprotein beta subunit
MDHPLHTVVCLKVVPKPEEVHIDPDTLTLDRAHARSEVNPSDMNALETALALKDRYGGTISLLAMGPPLFEPYLRVGLAMGADAAYLLSDRAFGGADTLATSYTLAEGIKMIGLPDLVLCGEESSDGATGQVPPGIAEWLGITQVTYATDLSLITGRWWLRATRDFSEGHEIVTAALPAVVSLRSRCNEPRFMDMVRREWAAKAPITVWSAADLGADPEMIGLPGSATVVAGTQEAPRRDRRRVALTGSIDEKARALAEVILPYVNGEQAALN